MNPSCFDYSVFTISFIVVVVVDVVVVAVAVVVAAAVVFLATPLPDIEQWVKVILI